MIKSEYIKLGQFLKYNNIVQSGAEAKNYLDENNVLINGEQENRRGRKLYPGTEVKTKDGIFIIGKE